MEEMKKTLEKCPTREDVYFVTRIDALDEEAKNKISGGVILFVLGCLIYLISNGKFEKIANIFASPGSFIFGMGIYEKISVRQKKVEYKGFKAGRGK